MPETPGGVRVSPGQAESSNGRPGVLVAPVWLAFGARLIGGRFS